MHDLKIDIGYWFNRVRMEVHQAFEARLAEDDITIAQWCILLVLYNKQATSIKELSEYIETDKASISRVVERLVNKKLVTRVTGKDRRSGHISLTATGLKLVPKLITKADENEKQFFGHLTKKELTQLKAIFSKILKAIPLIQLGGWLEEKNK
jgi:DNA-binding MarR family transcriptional regulator